MKPEKLKERFSRDLEGLNGNNPWEDPAIVQRLATILAQSECGACCMDVPSEQRKIAKVALREIFQAIAGE